MKVNSFCNVLKGAGGVGSRENGALAIRVKKKYVTAAGSHYTFAPYPMEHGSLGLGGKLSFSNIP
jgi:hypothetical protein